MNRFEKIDRYWHTLRHLKPVQFYRRAWFRLVRPRPDCSPAPSIRPKNPSWTMPARRSVSLVGEGEFVFLGQSGRLSDIGWNGEAREKLWRYNQHYFDDLNAMNADQRLLWHHSLLSDWVKGNPPAKGDGWEPYPTSLRIVNWIKWAMAGNELSAGCLHSLATQTRWLTKRLEYHLLGNHLFSNAKALVFAGLFFKGNEADQWLALGMKILSGQIPEQILPDGGHFERSTMYHVLALEDLLDLHNLAMCYPKAMTDRQQNQVVKWPEIINKMRRWLQVMSHPDGHISFFNDAAFGIAPSIEEIDAYVDRLAFVKTSPMADVERLESSGYVRLAKDDAVVLLDIAPVGPDHLPGHAHADTLGFELSLFGQRSLVNSGTSCYGASKERLRQRGTAAHNTVVINGKNSSQVWSGFRVARRAKPFDVSVQSGEVLSVQGSHDGYTRLPGHPVHQRIWTLGDGELTIVDNISGQYEAAEARFHFHPDISLFAGFDGVNGEGKLPDGTLFKWQAICAGADIEPTSWHPEFGSSIDNQCLVLKLEQGHCQLKISWEPQVSLSKGN